MNQFIPLSKYVDEALDLGWVSTGGAFITRLEKDLASFLHTEEVAACQSGTAALHLSLVEAGIRPGDAVLVPPLTFIAAVNPVKYQFATPIFIDCDDSFCMDPVKLRSFCEQDMVSIMEIAETYHLTVIEDATEALGTCYTEGPFAGRYAGTIGHFGAFSFNGNKIITTGGGGAVTAQKAETVRHLRFLSTQAKTDPHYYIHDEIGYNYRMTNLQAALGVAQMEELPEFIRRKQRNYELKDSLTHR